MTASLFLSISISVGYLAVLIFSSTERCSLNSYKINTLSVFTYQFSHISIKHLLGNITGIWVAGLQLKIMEIIFVSLVSHFFITIYAMHYISNRFLVVGASGIYWSILVMSLVFSITKFLENEIISLIEVAPLIIVFFSFLIMLFQLLKHKPENWWIQKRIHLTGGTVGLFIGIIGI